MTVVVNLFGGPGCGKSTTAAALFAELKMQHVNCELVTEFAKDKVWEHNAKIFDAQPYLFGKQYWKIKRCLGEVDFIITDSPLLLSIVYNNKYAKLQYFNSMVKEIHDQFNNMNWLVRRENLYQTSGRNESHSEALLLDDEIEALLIALEEGYFIKNAHVSISQMAKWVINEATL